MSSPVLFWDSSAIIYSIAKRPSWAHAVAAALQALPGDFAYHAVSEISWMECRVRPLRNGNLAELDLCDRFFAQPRLRRQAVDHHVLDHAARLRAQYRLRAPDAIIAATALRIADEAPVHLLTGDADFARVPGLQLQRIALDA